MSDDPELDEIHRVVAVATAMAVEVLRPCPRHRKTVLRLEGANPEDAYEYAEKMFAAGHLDGLFDSHEQLMAAMKAAIAHHVTPRCELCEPSRPN